MNRPILIIAIGYIIGIIWGLYLQISIAFLYALLAIIYIIIQMQYQKQKFKMFSIKRYFRYLKLIFKINVIITIIISSLISNAITKYQNQKYENLYNEGKIELIGIVVSNKKEKEYSNRYKIEHNNKYLYINTAKNIELEYGDKVEIIGEFQEAQKARNYKGFNYKEYLKTLKIYGTVNVDKIEIIEKDCANRILTASNKIFLQIKEKIELNYNEKTQGIILGVLLGYTEKIDEEIKEQFSESNISHVLAISGMHISYIIFLVTNSTQKVLGKSKSKVIASIVLTFYMFITNFSVSVVRASIMGIINCLSFVVYRKNDTINNLAITALIILINNPFSLISINFLLTYGGTIGIILFNKNIEKSLKNIKIKNRRWKYIFIKIKRKCEFIIEIMSVSITAQIIIAPIMILKFNTIGISFLITNLLLNTVIGVIVMGGLIQIIVSFISVKSGIAIAKVLEIPTYGLILISKINFGNFRIITPDLYIVITYYIVIILFNYLYKIFHSKNLNLTQTRVKNTIYVIKYKMRPYKHRIKYLSIILIFSLILISKIPQNLRIYFIDVGQGDSTLIITPNKKTILIDGGGSETYDVGKNTLIPYLLDRKINEIDYAIISHFDQDHSGGLFTVLKEMKVKNVITSKQFEDSKNYQEFLKIIKENKIKVYEVQRGQRINIEKGLYFDVIWPNFDNVVVENALNNNSLVCKLNYYSFSMLFTGDIEKIAEEKILEEVNSEFLEADILKVAHHSSKTSNIEKFIEKVNPKIALIGVGKNNKFGHPNSDVINRLEKLRRKSL